MAVLIRPRAWGPTQPNRPTINWGHPLARGLVFAQVGAARGVPPVTSGTWGGFTYGADWSATVSASRIAYTNDSNYLVYGDANISGKMYAAAGGYTVLVRERHVAGAGLAQYFTADGQAFSGGTGDRIWQVRSDLAVAFSDSTFQTAGWGTTTATDGNPHDLALVMNWASAANMVTYADGHLGATATLAGTHANVLAETPKQGGSTATSTTFDVFHVYCWARPLQQAELQWLNAEPYAFLTSKPRRFGLTPPAAPIPPHPNPLLQNAVYRM